MSMSRYPSPYIDRQFRNFFIKYNASSTTPSLLPCINTPNQFFTLRNQLLHKNTTRQRQVNKSLTTVIIDNDHPKNVKVKQIWQSAPTSLQDNLIIHAPYENRLRLIRSGIRTLWSTLFAETNVLMTKLIIGTAQRRNARSELVKTCPPLFLLRLTPTNPPRQTQP